MKGTLPTRGPVCEQSGSGRALGRPGARRLGLAGRGTLQCVGERSHVGARGGLEDVGGYA